MSEVPPRFERLSSIHSSIQVLNFGIGSRHDKHYCRELVQGKADESNISEITKRNLYLRFSIRVVPDPDMPGGAGIYNSYFLTAQNESLPFHVSRISSIETVPLPSCKRNFTIHRL